MTPVTIVGMGMSPADLTEAQRQIIESAEVLIGGRRHLAHFAHLGAEMKAIDRNLAQLVETIRGQMAQRRIVVLASGDPLYFGIGAYLSRSLGPDNVTVLPNISAPAAAFARLKEPWQNVPVVSLHGRDGQLELLEAIRHHPTVAVYTDPDRNPAWLAGHLMQNGLGDATLCIFEQLGSPDESVHRLAPRQARDKRFADPNLVVVKREAGAREQPAALHLGMAEEAFEHEQGLITKSEMRAVTLAKLKLAAGHVFWDLGAGSGSVAVEASLFVTRGKIYAVEKRPHRVFQIEENRRRFQAANLEVIAAELPQGLEALPDPDRIFVGGGGRSLEDILRTSVGRLRPQGIVVINTVLIQSMQAALKVLEAAGLKTELVQIQVNRGSAMPYGQRLAAENPVWIVSGSKG